MVIHILVSAALVLTGINRAPAPANTREHQGGFSTLGRGMAQIWQVGAALKETMAQKKIIDSIAAKPVLSQPASAALGRALDKLAALNKNLIPKKK